MFDIGTNLVVNSYKDYLACDSGVVRSIEYKKSAGYILYYLELNDGTIEPFKESEVLGVLFRRRENTKWLQ